MARVNTCRCGRFDQKLAAVTLLIFFTFIECERFWRESCVLDDMYHYWIWKNHWNIDRRKSTLLSVAKNFFRKPSIRFPRQMVIKTWKLEKKGFDQKFVMYFRTEGAKNSCGFVSILECKAYFCGNNFWKEITRKRILLDYIKVEHKTYWIEVWWGKAQRGLWSLSHCS